MTKVLVIAMTMWLAAAGPGVAAGAGMAARESAELTRLLNEFLAAADTAAAGAIMDGGFVWIGPAGERHSRPPSTRSA